MFGEIIAPVNRLSENVSSLNSNIFDLKMAIMGLIEEIQINTQEVQSMRAAYENNKK